MALAYLTLGERRFYTSSGTWPARSMKLPHLCHQPMPRGSLNSKVQIYEARKRYRSEHRLPTRLYAIASGLILADLLKLLKRNKLSSSVSKAFGAFPLLQPLSSAARFRSLESLDIPSGQLVDIV